MQLRIALNFSSSLHFPSASITGSFHHFYFVLDYPMSTVEEILVHSRAKLILLQAGIEEEWICL